MKTWVAVLVLLLVAVPVLADKPIAEVYHTEAGPPPGAAQLLENGDWDSGQWYPWQDRTGDPFCSLSTAHPESGQYHFRMGPTLEGSWTWTHQDINISFCDPAQPLWLYRCISIYTEEPPPLTCYVNTTGTLWRNDWTELAWLWSYCEDQHTAGQYRCDWFVCPDCLLYTGGDVIYYDLATQRDARPYPTIIDVDTNLLYCMPKVAIGNRVYLPCICSQ